MPYSLCVVWTLCCNEMAVYTSESGPCPPPPVLHAFANPTQLVIGIEYCHQKGVANRWAQTATEAPTALLSLARFGCGCDLPLSEHAVG